MGAASLQLPTGETFSEALASTGLGLAMLYAWPLVLLALVRIFRWSGFLRALGLASLATMTGRGLIVSAAHLLAVRNTETSLAASKIWLLADPIEWAFMIAGVVLCVRARRRSRA
jgi:hypothetical protein